jgi:hypothetical protein
MGEKFRAANLGTLALPDAIAALAERWLPRYPRILEDEDGAAQ